MRRFQLKRCVIAAAAGYAIFALCPSAAAAEGPSIFPTPREITSGSDFVLDEQAVIENRAVGPAGSGPPHDRDWIDRQSPGADGLRKSQPVREPARSGSRRLHSPDQRGHRSGGRQR